MILVETLGERLSDAGINTLICIVVVFCVLIFISLVISLFGIIPKAQAAMARRKEKKDDIKSLETDAVENTITQIAEKEESELVDDCELVAVIAAAIAASTGTSTDGFVVRSIRKVRR